LLKRLRRRRRGRERASEPAVGLAVFALDRAHARNALSPHTSILILKTQYSMSVFRQLERDYPGIVGVLPE
jgi:hypothetical protein